VVDEEVAGDPASVGSAHDIGAAPGEQGHVALTELDGRVGPELEAQGAVLDEVQHPSAGGMAVAVGIAGAFSRHGVADLR
jgi:hypothetical protein